MSTTWTRAAGATLLLAALSGCGAHASATSARPAGAPSRSAGASASPTPVASSPSPAATPAPPGADELKDVALGLDDLPAGYSVAKPGTLPPLAASSKDPSCADLVAVVNATASPHALATGSYEFDGGPDGGYYGERLDSFPIGLSATDSMIVERVAEHTCPELTLKLPDYGPAAFTVSEISFPGTGYGYAVRLTATAKDLDGLEVLLAGSSTDGVAVHLLADADPEEAQAVMQTALGKVHDRFGTTHHTA